MVVAPGAALALRLLILGLRRAHVAAVAWPTFTRLRSGLSIRSEEVVACEIPAIDDRALRRGAGSRLRAATNIHTSQGVLSEHCVQLLYDKKFAVSLYSLRHGGCCCYCKQDTMNFHRGVDSADLACATVRR
eukprot:COSAG02_NODE_7_length_64539_cov_120.393482_21_plen_132_part_00